ncbi:uncharacterized protein PgNI_09475 [Pyricularia grisea]|uniref:Uncharacterized protein n=1 Tax=Pyricularia grisea TaxID=148305 RepID=A0A6P8ASE8_PYRGI|nr:uncharacterized protein PgNI_09475 [Pyricularia grisea]TLD05022.1 hypothetical protein PgNI_09475 [Pyricularia grisea]
MLSRQQKRGRPPSVPQQSAQKKPKLDEDESLVSKKFQEDVGSTGQIQSSGQEEVRDPHTSMEGIMRNTDDSDADSDHDSHSSQASQPEWFKYLEAKIEETENQLSFSKSLKKLRRWWLSGRPSSYREKALGAIDKALFVAAWIVQGAMWSKETEWQLYSLCLDPKKLIMPSGEDIFIDVATAEIQMSAIEDQILDKKLRAMWPMPIEYDDISDSN